MASALSRLSSLSQRYRRCIAIGLLVGLGWFLLEQNLTAWRAVASLEQRRLEDMRLVTEFQDYIAFYAAGKLVAQGEGDQIYDRDSIDAVEREAADTPVGDLGGLPYFNPPFVAALFAPSSLLSLASFSLVMMLINLLALLAAGLMLDRMLRLGPRARIFFWLGFLSTVSVIWLVKQGQLTMLPFFAWLGFAWFQMQGQPRKAGIALALGLVKPQLVLLPVLLLVWKRDWTALQPFAAIAAALALISVVVSGPAVLIEYPRFLLQSTRWSGEGVNYLIMYNWGSLAAHVTVTSPPPQLLVYALQLATLGLLAWAWRGPWSPSSPRFPQLVGMTLVASLLISPHLYLPELSLLTIAVALGAMACRQQPWGIAAWWTIAGALWLLQQLARYDSALSGPAVVSAALVVLMLGLALWSQARRTEAKETPPGSRLWKSGRLSA